jgi:hypothetical protein
VVPVGLELGVGDGVTDGTGDGEPADGEGEAPAIDVVVAFAVTFAETLGLVPAFVELVQPATAPTARTITMTDTIFFINVSSLTMSFVDSRGVDFSKLLYCRH